MEETRDECRSIALEKVGWGWGAINSQREFGGVVESSRTPWGKVLELDGVMAT